MKAGFAALGLMSLALWILDHWQLPEAFVPLSQVTRLVVMLPLAALGFGMTYVLGRHEALVRVNTLVFAGFTLAAIVLDGFLARAAAPLAFSGVSAALLIGCTTMGLRFWPALDVCGALALLAIGTVMFALGSGAGDSRCTHSITVVGIQARLPTRCSSTPSGRLTWKRSSSRISVSATVSPVFSTGGSSTAISSASGSRRSSTNPWSS